MLARQPSSCLERALVLQRWLLAQGEPFDVVIGVRREDGAFAAHAWVDQVDPSSPEKFTELHRLPAR